jgi:magnesium-transporting ATPase (P-type)
VYDDWYITCYNLIFTALPLLFRAVYDIDVDMPGADCTPEIRKAYALTYLPGRTNEYFTFLRFCQWIGIGLLHSLIAWGVPFLALESQILTEDGYNSDLWSYSMISFSCVMFMVTIKFITITRVWNWLVIMGVTFLSIAIYVLFIFVYDFVQITWMF